MEAGEPFRVSKEGRVMTSPHSLCPRVPPTRTHHFPQSHPPFSHNPHPHCRVDPEKAVCCVPARLLAEAQELAVGPGGPPSPSPGPGGGGLALSSPSLPLPGYCWGKFMFLSGLGTGPTLKRKKKERKKLF